MKQFLRETWQLWFWANFCPSRLQQRREVWKKAAQEEQRQSAKWYVDVILLRATLRFVQQFITITFITTIPLIILIAANNQSIPWSLIIGTIVGSYVVGSFILPLGLHLPLFVGIIYLGIPVIPSNPLQVSLVLVINLVFLQGFSIGCGITLVVLLVFKWWLQRRRVGISHVIFVMFGAVYGALIILTIRQQWPVALIVSSALAWLLYSFIKRRSHKILILSVLAISVLVLASIPYTSSLFVETDQSFKVPSFFDILTFVIRGFFVTAGMAALFYMLLGSFAWVTAGGNTKEVAQAQMKITAAVVGLILIVAVLAIVWSLEQIVFRGKISFGLSSPATIPGLLPDTDAGLSSTAESASPTPPTPSTGIGENLVTLMETFITQTVNVINSIATLPLPLLLTMSWLVAFSAAPTRRWWLGLLIAVPCGALGFSYHGWGGALAVAFGALIGYYRLVPNYIALVLMILQRSLRLRFRLTETPTGCLQTLPPYIDELLWLPLPGHSRLLTAAFRAEPSAALLSLQQMRLSALPGFQVTLRRALPQIVADQLMAVDTPADITTTATAKHPTLPLIIPAFYSSSDIDDFFDTTNITMPVDVNDEIKIMLPRLQKIARGIHASLKPKNPALIERGLERRLNDVRMLQEQMPGLKLRPRSTIRWTPVLERWRQVIEAEIARQSPLAQGKSLNPFQAGNPIFRERAYLFKGRIQFAEEIVRQVLDHGNSTFILYGPRRCGKSSFLLNLPRLLPNEVLPIYYSLQSGAATESESHFCFGLVRSIIRDLRSQGIEVSIQKEREDFFQDPYTNLRDWLDQISSLLDSHHLLLCFDEFENVGDAINRKKMSEVVLGELRDLSQHHPKLGFVFCGMQTLDDLGPKWSRYFNHARPIEMVYLEPDEAKELLEDPDEDFNLHYAEGVVDLILAVTRCQPYLLQLIGEVLIQQADQHDTKIISKEILEFGIKKAFLNGAPYFYNHWHEYSGTHPDEIAVGRKILYDLGHGQNDLRIEDQATRSALNRLVRYHVLECINGTYGFEIPLVERWVREYAPLP